MDKLSKDELYSIATKMQLHDIIRFCETNKVINEKICGRNDIWYFLLKRDFSNDSELFNFIVSPNKTYIFLYSLNKFKNKYFPTKDYPNETLLDIYNKKEIYLSYRNLKEVPKIIPYLTNLQILYLHNNEIKEIPESLSNLINLKELYLSDNQIK